MSEYAKAETSPSQADWWGVARLVGVPAIIVLTGIVLWVILWPNLLWAGVFAALGLAAAVIMSIMRW